MTSRRNFLQAGAGSLLASTLPIAPHVGHSGASAPFLDLTRGPDVVSVKTSSGETPLRKVGAERWEGDGITLRATAVSGALRVELSAPSVAVLRVGLRWNESMTRTRLLLGDAWERGYGDLEWRGFVPDRLMPWYVMAHDGTRTDGYGVRTGAAAFCAWQADGGGLSLWADVRSGGSPLQLGDRSLVVCEVVCRAGKPGESGYAALRAFCHQMCPAPRLPAQPVYGSNDWYWAFGKNSAASAITDAQRIVGLSPGGSNRPFVVIDDGWQPGRGASKVGAGNWDRGNENFPDLPGLAARVKQLGGRMGAWIRPLEAANDVTDSWRLSRDKKVLDPTVPAVREKITSDMARLRGWGMELIKHDYSSWDIFGRWGFQMGSAMTRDGWSFSEGARRTTAEVINGMYQDIRRGAGDAVVIGCNTVSHLSAGVFELCRTGDDTGGPDWSRTRKMGVNTMAFRIAQHGAFYAADADCASVVAGVPWELSRQWIDLVARSGTPLFMSMANDAMGEQQNVAIRRALAGAAAPQALAEPMDWMQTTWPSRWKLDGTVDATYQWGHAEG